MCHSRASLRIGALVSFLIAGPCVADNNSLVVEQIGEGHRAAVVQDGAGQSAEIVQGGTGARDNRARLAQGSAPEAAAAAAFLGLDAGAPRFALRDAGALDGAGAVAGVDATLADLLGELDGAAPGTGNAAELRQTGSGNRALAVQVGGRNRMLTEQQGDGNVGVHLQRGHGNDTELVQHGGGNVNALLAEGAVVGNDGGPLRLRATGDVRGFSIRASGPQSYGTATVSRNGRGGLNIHLQAR